MNAAATPARARGIVSYQLQEVGIMTPHLIERMPTESFMGIVRSVELFVGMIIVISVLGIVFFAAA